MLKLALVHISQMVFKMISEIFVITFSISNRNLHITHVCVHVLKGTHLIIIWRSVVRKINERFHIRRNRTLWPREWIERSWRRSVQCYITPNYHFVFGRRRWQPQRILETAVQHLHSTKRLTNAGTEKSRTFQVFVYLAAKRMHTYPRKIAKT